MLHILRTRLSGAAGVPLIAALCALMAAPAGTSLAQEASPTPAAQAAGAPEESPKLSMDQLESLVAPIALYPDNLLAQVLMASTYPLEVVQAARWLAANPNVKDKALVVNHQNLMPARHVLKIHDELADGRTLVECWDDDRRVRSDINHVAKRKLMMSPS